MAVTSYSSAAMFHLSSAKGGHLPIFASAATGARIRRSTVKLRSLLTFTAIAAGVFAVGNIAQPSLTRAQSPAAPGDAEPERYLPEYTSDGDLKLPKNWRRWVFVGAPLTPNALNGGKANFPEYHNVYMEPGYGADVVVKDSKRFAATGGWGFFNFHHYEPKAETASVRPKEECAYCHIASAKKDDVWTQYYPMLDTP